MSYVWGNPWIYTGWKAPNFDMFHVSFFRNPLNQEFATLPSPLEASEFFQAHVWGELMYVENMKKYVEKIKKNSELSPYIQASVKSHLEQCTLRHEVTNSWF